MMIHVRHGKGVKIVMYRCPKRILELLRAYRQKPATVNPELAILSGVFRMAVDYDKIATIRGLATRKQSANEAFIF
jgi:hypothetical protein